MSGSKSPTWPFISSKVDQPICQVAISWNSFQVTALLLEFARCRPVEEAEQTARNAMMDFEAEGGHVRLLSAALPGSIAHILPIQ